MQVWNVLHVARWKYRTQKIAICAHRITLLSYIFATKAHINNRKKNLLNSNISSTCPHNMVNFGPLTAEIGWQVWATPANFDGFRTLASLLHRRRSTEVNKTLHDVCPSPGLVYYIYIFGGFCPLKIDFALSCILLYWQSYCTALEQWASTKLCGVGQGRELRNFCSPFAPPIFKHQWNFYSWI